MTVQPFAPTGSVVPVGADLDAQMRYAEVLSTSGLLPDTFRGKPANVLTAIALASAMDESVLTVTGNLTMVGSKPGWEAKFMRQRARRFGHRVVEAFDKATMTATCTIFRADDPKTPITVVVDRARAEKSGWWGKGYWLKDPELMLENRALSFCVRKACNEVLGGVNYTVDEVRDETGDGAASVQQVRDWAAEVDAAQSLDELQMVWSAAHRAHALGAELRARLTAAKARLAAPPADVVDAVVVTEEPPINPATGEFLDEPAPADPAPRRLTKAQATQIKREFARLGADDVKAWAPLVGVPDPNALSPEGADALIATLSAMTRDDLSALVADRAAEGAGS